MAQILDGKALNEKIAQNLKTEIARTKTLRARGPLGRPPKLVIIQIGDRVESNAYIARKVKFAEKIDAIVELQKFQNEINQTELITYIQKLNADNSVHGIIIQLPIPDSLDKDQLIETIYPKKDVDGLTSANLKLLWENKKNAFIPATTKGILTLLEHYKIEIALKNAVVVGRSTLVGKPTAMALLNKDATVTIAHSKTENLQNITKQADILISAVGKPNLITKNYVNINQVVIDVGITSLPNGADSRHELVGDVNFEEVSQIVKAITPVPGGIGPMTVASLFQNLLDAYHRQV